MPGPAPVPGTGSWPRWAPWSLLGAGVVLIALETTNAMVVPGILLAGTGVFGLARRGGSRRAEGRRKSKIVSPGSARVDRPGSG
jgi:hypothetical protein